MTSSAMQLLMVLAQLEPDLTGQTADLAQMVISVAVLAASLMQAVFMVLVVPEPIPTTLKAVKGMIFSEISSEICSAAERRAASIRVPVDLMVSTVIPAVLAQMQPVKKAVMHRQRSI